MDNITDTWYLIASLFITTCVCILMIFRFCCPCPCKVPQVEEHLEEQVRDRRTSLPPRYSMYTFFRKPSYAEIQEWDNSKSNLEEPPPRYSAIIHTIADSSIAQIN